MGGPLLINGQLFKVLGFLALPNGDRQAILEQDAVGGDVRHAQPLGQSPGVDENQGGLVGAEGLFKPGAQERMKRI